MFYDNVKELCYRKRTTITALVKELGMSTSMPTKWKSGAQPNAETLKRMADYFEVSTDALLREDASYFSDKEVSNKKTADQAVDGLRGTGYAKLNAENRAVIDSLIEKLLKSQSGE